MRPHAAVAAAAAAVSIALAAGGCASSLPGRPGSTPTPLRADPGQIVFQVSSGPGGLSPLSYVLGHRPEVTVYGNGDAYVLPSDEENRSYPGRPLAFVKGHVPPAALRRLALAAGASGLFDGADYGMARITDAGGTSVTFRPGRAAAHRVSVYALDIEDADRGLSERQQQNRQALRAFADRVGAAVIRPDADPEAWTPERVDVTRVAEAENDSDGPATPWPGPPVDGLLRPASSGRDGCGVLAGSDARRVWNSAREHGTTRWSDRGMEYRLVVRALLPGESGCR